MIFICFVFYCLALLICYYNTANYDTRRRDSTPENFARDMLSTSENSLRYQTSLSNVTDGFLLPCHVFKFSSFKNSCIKLTMLSLKQIRYPYTIEVNTIRHSGMQKLLSMSYFFSIESVHLMV